MNRRAAVHVRRQLARRARPARSGPGSGRPPRWASIGLIAPTLEITHTGQEETLDGVLIRFQMTPGTECPVEMNFLFPERRALCMAENATHNLHNLLTLRGAVVRDAAHLGPLPQRGHRPVRRRHADVAFASHHWPTWGRDRIVTYLSPAARPLRLPARPDPAADEPGLHRHRDRRDGRDAAGARGGVAHPRLLRVGQPQREGDLPALPRLVRRQPGQPLAAPAGRGAPRRYVERLRRRRRRHRQGPGLHRRRRPALRGRAAQPRRVRRRVEHARPRAAGRRLRHARLRRRERHLAQLLPPGRVRAAPRRAAEPRSTSAGVTRHGRRAAVDQLFDSVAIRVERARRRGTSTSPSTGSSPTSAAPTALELTNGVLIQDVDPKGGAGRPHRHAHQAAAPRPARRQAASTASRPTATPASSRRCSPSSTSRIPTSPSSRPDGAEG